MDKKNCLTLDDEFMQYCKLNNIEDIQKLARKIFNRGFAIEKYGEVPFSVKQNIVTEIKKEDPLQKTEKIKTDNLYEE
jgi:hypothetical protein